MPDPNPAMVPHRFRWFGWRFFRKIDASELPTVKHYGVHLWFGARVVDLSVTTAVLGE